MQKAKQFHPDARLNENSRRRPPSSVVAGKHEWFAILSAYQTLSNPQSRIRYDASNRYQYRSSNSNVAFRAKEDPNFSEMVLKTKILKHEFHAALQTAYFGPPLPSGLNPGQFPDCFEADERSSAETDDILHLVFGRQVLGVVRLRRSLNALNGDPCDDKLPLSHESFHTPPTPHGHAPLQGHHYDAHDDDRLKSPQNLQDEILDLLVEDVGESAAEYKIVATAVRSWVLEDDKGRGKKKVKERVTTIYKSGKPVAYVVDDGPQSRKNVARVYTSCLPHSTCTTRLASHTHTVLRGSTPLIKHLAILTNTNVCVAKARRPWLPPSSFWLFKPRVHTHDTGGWVISWPGHHQEAKPGWLCPEVIVFIIALDTVDQEVHSKESGIRRFVGLGGDKKEKMGHETAWKRWKGKVESIMFGNS